MTSDQPLLSPTGLPEVSASTEELSAYFDRLWPIMRSITGDGVRQTHEILSEILPLERTEILSGTQVLDWTIPAEWVYRHARLIGPDGNVVLDANDNNLHLLNYSAPFKGQVDRKELEEHLYSDPEQPDAIPYFTSYYTRRWGFCLSQNQRDALPEGVYSVDIDTSFKENGSLTYSEAVLPGDTDEEILFSTYTCHPSMANNELSGPLITAFLYRELLKLQKRHYTYRFLFIPETIGALTYLARHGERLKENLTAGFVMTCLGNDAPLTVKRSRQHNSLADRTIEAAWKHNSGMRMVDFFPSGSDERQYCSPGFDLPVCSVSRSQPAQYPEYHTSLDNRDFISFEAMVRSVVAFRDLVHLFEMNGFYRNLFPYGEPQLGRRGLFSTLGAARDAKERYQIIQWLLNFSDGEHDLIAIAERSGLPIWQFHSAVPACVEAGVLERIRL